MKADIVFTGKGKDVVRGAWCSRVADLHAPVPVIHLFLLVRGQRIQDLIFEDPFLASFLVFYLYHTCGPRHEAG